MQHRIDGIAYTLEDGSPLYAALVSRQREHEAIQTLATHTPILTSMGVWQSELAELEQSLTGGDLINAPIDAEKESRITALRRRIAQTQPQYDAAIDHLRASSERIKALTEEITQYEHRVRVAAQQRDQLAQERAAFEARQAPAEASIGRDLRLVLGGLKPGDTREQHSPDQPRPFWPVGSGYLPEQPVIIERAISPEERAHLESRYLHPWYEGYDEGRKRLERGMVRVQIVNGREIPI